MWVDYNSVPSTEDSIWGNYYKVWCEWITTQYYLLKIASEVTIIKCDVGGLQLSTITWGNYYKVMWVARLNSVLSTEDSIC